MTTWPRKTYCVFRLGLIGGLYLHRNDALRTQTSPFNKNNKNTATYRGMWQCGPRNSNYALGWGLPILGTWHCLQAEPDYCNICKKACIWQHDRNYIEYSDWDWLRDFICIVLMYGALKHCPLTKITNMAAYWGMWQYGPCNSYYVLRSRLPIWEISHPCVSPSRPSPTIVTCVRKLVYDNMTKKNNFGNILGNVTLWSP
jgi:hypothetical protein